MTIEPMTFDEVKNVFRNALDKANTPTELIQNILTISYEKGYVEGKRQTWSEETLKTESEMYAKGLNDAWECVMKIIADVVDGGFDSNTLKLIFGTPIVIDIFKINSASEAIAKIKEYEEKHKCKECKWDEFRDAQSPVGTPCDSCFEGKNFSPKLARCCSILDDICPYDIKCEECEVHCSVERAKQKLKGDKNDSNNT